MHLNTYRRKTLRPRRFAAVGLALGMTLVLGCARDHEDTPGARHAAPVTVVAAVSRDAPWYLDGIGTVVPVASVSIRSQASGQIMTVHVEDGADVDRSQLLFTIDPRPYRAALDKAAADLLLDKAHRDLAKLEMQLIAAAREQGATSPDEFETKQSTLAAAEAQVQADQASVDAAQVNLDYCSIESPIAGRAGRRLVDPGNIVLADSGTVLMVIRQLDPIRVDFTITEGDLPVVRERMSLDTLTTKVHLPNESPSTAREGTLTFLDNAVERGTGTVRLQATIPNADRRFWPGQFVRVRLVLDILPSAVLVPVSATQVSQNGPYVYVVKADSAAEFRPVTLGQRQDDLIVVRQGLAAGETVVVTGQLGVTPGAAVRVLTPSPSGGEPSR